MKKLFGVMFAMLLTSNLYAATVTVPTTWITGDSVTATKLNNINTAFANAINGGLDNDNANTASGYRFFKTVSVLPAAGTQGAVYFLTSDNTLNFDTGSTFIKTVAVSTPSQGDVIYYNGASWVSLAAGTSGLYLKTQGAGANPTWDEPLPSFKLSSTTRNMATASGTQDITDCGFTPRAIIFLANQTGNSRTSVGMSTVTADESIYYSDSAITWNTSTGTSIVAGSGSDQQVGEVTATSSNGFTITWVKSGSPTGTLNILYMCIR